MELGKIFILSGPAGVGKSTVSRHLVEHCRGRLKKIVTVTTRMARPGEIDGVDYLFMDEETFLKHVEEDKFLEYASIHRKHFYGTPMEPVLGNVRRGIDSLLLVDVQGMMHIRRRLGHLSRQIVTIFIRPERLDVLEERLRGRGSESVDDLEWRLKSAIHEMKFANRYDYIVISGSVEEDFASVEMVHRWERTKITKGTATATNLVNVGKKMLPKKS
ncbi:MAG: guanylate kinase [Puniceicoccales bacterium]|jgi:guanylate kinase|nr:guanylate kinase [Puniceicoccales bacterium]